MSNEISELLKPILCTVDYVFGKKDPRDDKWDICFVFDNLTHPSVFKYLIENMKIHIVIISKTGEVLNNKPVGLTSHKLENNRAYMTISTTVMLGEKSVSAKNKISIGDKVLFRFRGSLLWEFKIQKERA